MNHVDEGVLQALADGELSAEERDAVQRHLDACAACRAEMEALRTASVTLGGALALLDRPAPRGRDFVRPTPRQASAPRVWRSGRSLARAAVLVLGFAAAASATIPGSPVRDWIGDLVSPRTEVAAVSGPAPAAESAPPAVAVSTAPVEAGISVLPAGGEVRVVLSEAARDLVVRAVLVDGPRAGVFASGEAASARFITGTGRIEVVGAGPGELRIELPRSAALARVVVNGTPFLTKRGVRLQLDSPAQDSSAAEVTFRVR